MFISKALYVYSIRDAGDPETTMDSKTCFAFTGKYKRHVNHNER